jgi:ribosome-associated translation inhibitor RaiA
MEAKLIERELKALEARRETLASEVEAARGKLDAARADLPGGQVKVAEVTATQSTYTALDEAVDALDTRIMDTRTRLAEARSEEQRAADVVRVREIGEEKARLTGELQAIFECANEALIDAVTAYTERTTRWVELTREMDGITERRTGFDPSRHRSSPLSDLQLAPVLPFGAAIAVAIQMEDNRSHTERRNEITRRDAARRRARELAARGEEARG